MLFMSVQLAVSHDEMSEENPRAELYTQAESSIRICGNQNKGADTYHT
jgi:hypothetical protein